MARMAAVIGPTPETLYWAIEQDCRLRTVDRRGVCQGAFRQLRALQETSRAIGEGRVTAGFALHESALPENPRQTSSGKVNPGHDRARPAVAEMAASLPARSGAEHGNAVLGFAIAEVLDAYGGRDLVEAACGNCPANTVAEQRGWAGCFGIVPFWSDESHPSGWVRTALSELHDEPSYGALLERGFRRTRPAWYGVWSPRSVAGVELELLLQLMRARVLPGLGSTKTHWPEFSAWITALELAQQNQLRMHLEFVPAGVSDGVNWELPASCGACNAHRSSRIHPCPICGTEGMWREERRRKVLGLRPYLKLVEIVGREKTEQLVHELRGRQSRTSQSGS